MRVIGVDPGRRHTGLISYHLTDQKLELATTIDLPVERARRIRPFNAQYYRLDQAQTQFSAYIKAQENIVLVVVEDYIYPKIPKMPREGNVLRAMYDAVVAKDFDTAREQARLVREEDAIALVEPMDWDSLSLAEIHGVLMAVLGRWGIPAIKVSPTQMKYFMTGKGNCDKREMIKKVHDYYGEEMTDEHQFDALAAAHVGRHFIQYCHRPNSLRPGYPRNVCNTLMYDKRFRGVAEKVKSNLQEFSEVGV